MLAVLLIANSAEFTSLLCHVLKASRCPPSELEFLISSDLATFQFV